MPYIKLQTTAYQEYSAKYSVDYRTAILNLAKKWNRLIDVQIADIDKAANKIIARPQKYGFNTSVIATPCYPGNYHIFNAPVCDKPDTYFFFDHVHPSAATIRILSNEFLDAF